MLQAQSGTARDLWQGTSKGTPPRQQSKNLVYAEPVEITRSGWGIGRKPQMKREEFR
jgi:hypothetical protein